MSCSLVYCIKNTGLVNVDDLYVLNGTFNDYNYWLGTMNGWVIYYSTGTTSQWCLSNTLGGVCSLGGKSPCFDDCPDLSSVYFFSGVCPTPTPTPTQNCDVLDFTAMFDCEFILTQTPTPTSSVTPTPTMTPTSTNYCSMISVDAEISTYTPTPTPTPTVTPTTQLPFYSPLIVRDCPVYGFANYSTIEGEIVCPGSQKFRDCYDTDQYYYSNQVTGVPVGTQFELYSTYSALVYNNGVTSLKCISYYGYDYNYGNINAIEITNPVSFGFSNEDGCINCEVAIATPTPTPTMTMTPTVTPTMTATMTPTPTQTLSQTPAPEYWYCATKCIPSSETPPIYVGDCWSNLTQPKIQHPSPSLSVGDTVTGTDGFCYSITEVISPIDYPSIAGPIITLSSDDILDTCYGCRGFGLNYITNLPEGTVCDTVEEDNIYYRINGGAWISIPVFANNSSGTINVLDIVVSIGSVIEYYFSSGNIRPWGIVYGSGDFTSKCGLIETVTITSYTYIYMNLDTNVSGTDCQFGIPC